MANHDGGQRDPPGCAGVNKADVGLKARGAEEVPAHAERIRGQCGQSL
jgi:hypothetical protein